MIIQSIREATREELIQRIKDLEEENKFLRDENSIYRNETISKSVIREKIEELEGNREKIEDKYYFDYQNNIYDFIAGMKKGLKELLGEEK